MEFLNKESSFQTESALPYWGLSSCIDLYECDLERMRSAEAIREFVRLLCERINMKRYGETQLVHFGTDPRVNGYSMMQLIETSLISAHFAEASRAIYLDVFSCAPYDPRDVAEFALSYFKGRRYNLHVVERK